MSEEEASSIIGDVLDGYEKDLQPKKHSALAVSCILIVMAIFGVALYFSGVWE